MASPVNSSNKRSLDQGNQPGPSKKPKTIGELPPELQGNILSFLPVLDKTPIPFVCQDWNTISNDEYHIHQKLESITELNLKSINLHIENIQSRTKKTLTMLELIIRCPNLKILDLSGSIVTDSEIEEICKNAPNLQILKLNNCPSLKSPKIEHLHALKELHLDSDNRIIDSIKLTDLPLLETLILPLLFSEIDLDELTSIKKLNLSSPILEELNLKDLTSLEDLAISSLFLEQPSFYNLPKLEKLRLKLCPKITNLDFLNGLNSLKYFNLLLCHNLEEADLTKYKLSSIETIFIHDCQKLGYVSFDGLFSLKDLQIQKCPHLPVLKLQHLKSLESLDLHNCDTLRYVILSELTSLKDLFIWGKNSLTQFQHKNLSSLSSLSIRSDTLTAIDLTHLLSLTIMRFGCPKLSEVNPSRFPNLISLRLTDSAVTDEILARICQSAPLLETIDLRACNSITSPDFRNFNNLLRIKMVNCSSLKSFKEPSSLNILCLDSCQGINDLDLTGYTNLQKLKIVDCNPLVTPIINKLLQLKNLKHFTLKHCGLETLTLSDLPLLETLILSELELQRLVLSRLPSIQSIDLEECSYLTESTYHQLNPDVVFIQPENAADAEDNIDSDDDID
jgi:hypothetical protein